MTSLAFIIALFVIAAVGVCGWMHHRSRKLAEEKLREGEERLAAERRFAHKKAMAEGKERIRQEAEDRENVRLTVERRIAAKMRAAEAEAKRQAEEQALAEAQARLTPGTRPDYLGSARRRLHEPAHCRVLGHKPVRHLRHRLR